MNQVANMRQDSAAWRFFVIVSFVVSLGATTLGVLILTVELWLKGYMAIVLYFTVSSTLILAKTIRDAHKAGKLINNISEARTEKMLIDFELNH